MLEFPQRRRVLWLLLATLGVVYFTVRGPVRAFESTGNADFRFIHNGVRTFWEGANPYNPAELMAGADRHDAGHSFRRFANTTLVYPPGFVTVFAPLAAVEPSTAPSVAVQLALFGLLLFLISRLSESRTIPAGLWVCSLYLAPVHTAIAHGQFALLFCVFLAGLFLALKRGNDLVAAVMLALLMTKPSFGAPGALVAMVQGRWKPLVLGAVLTMATWSPAFARWGVGETFTQYYDAISVYQQPGADGDDSRANPHRFDLINLRSWLYSCDLPDVLVLSLYLLLAVAAVAALYRYRQAADHARSAYWGLGAVFVSTVLFHRFYDASLLVFVIGALSSAKWGKWGSGSSRSPQDALKLAAIALVGVFIIPGTAAIRTLFAGELPQSPLFEAFVVRHQNLALILLGAVLVMLLERDRGEYHPAPR